MRRRLVLFIGIFLLVILSLNANEILQPVDYVNPFIGTGGHGHTFPGACVPFGMVQPSPDTGIRGWDWCSGYHYSDTTIMGFSQTHLSGTGAADYGEVMLMPMVGTLKVIPGPASFPDIGYRSRFRHDTEVAVPGYYAVTLDDYKIRVELTASKRVAFHRYTFPKADDAYVVLDLFHRIGGPSEEAWAKVIGDREIEGYIVGGHFCGAKDPHKIYFVIRFSKPFKGYGVWKVFLTLPNERTIHLRRQPGGVYVKFKTDQGEQILVKIAISYTGIEGARKNLKEIPDWDFDRVRKLARKEWNKELSKIEVFGGTDEQKTIFYTALYHALIGPNLFSDVDGRYIGVDKKIHKADHEEYTVFSIWDTFRAEHPLFVLVEPEKDRDFIKTLLDVYDEGGWMPKWYLANCYTNCMIGTHADSVIADAYMKGIRGFDVDKAYEAMYKDAMVPSNSWYEARGGIEYYKKLGYVPADKVGEATSRTLEFAYDDFCVAQIAKALGKTKDYKMFIKRAMNYKNVFDPSTGFMRGKSKDGTWVDGQFDPTRAYRYFTEGNAWQWTFFVPQDVEGLIKLMGGRAKFIDKLDELFTAPSKVEGPPDITGLIGQYAHGNEPSHHIAYLYDYAGEPWKTQERVREIMEKLYGSGPAGLCGNEDVGQMSAWYVFSAMGFYPVCPGTPAYEIGSPMFDRVTIHLGNGKEFIIQANNNSKENMYIQTAVLDKRTLTKPWFMHSDLINGGKLVFTMGPKPNEKWGSNVESSPPSISKSCNK